MWANSWASSASNCSGVSPVNAEAGTNIAGRSQPITVGTSTSADSHRRTGRDTLSRAHRAAAFSCHSGLASLLRSRLRRRVKASPPAKRMDRPMTPTNHNATSHGTKEVTLSRINLVTGRDWPTDASGSAFDDAPACTDVCCEAPAGKSRAVAAYSSRLGRDLVRAFEPELKVDAALAGRFDKNRIENVTIGSISSSTSAPQAAAYRRLADFLRVSAPNREKREATKAPCHIK